jgi:hypothetical protein
VSPLLRAKLAKRPRFDPALRAAEELVALIAILATIAVFGAVFAALLAPVAGQ